MTRTALPHPRRHKGKQAPAPRRQDETQPRESQARHATATGTSSMTTRQRDAPRDEKTRRHTGRERTPRHAAREQQDHDGTSKHATLSDPQGIGERDDKTRRKVRSKTRRQANDEGKHHATPQDKRMTLRPPTRRHGQSRKTGHPPRANTTTTIQHETLYETARQDEEREA